MHQHVDMEQKEIPFSTVKLSHLRLRYGGENSLLLLPYTLPKAKRHMCVVFTSLQDDKQKSRPERPDPAPLFLNFCNSMQSFSLVCQSIRNLNIHILNNSLWGWEKYSSHTKTWQRRPSVYLFISGEIHQQLSSEVNFPSLLPVISAAWKSAESRSHQQLTSRKIAERDLCFWPRQESYYSTERSFSAGTVSTSHNNLSLSASNTNTLKRTQLWRSESPWRTVSQPLRPCRGCQLRRSARPIAKLLVSKNYLHTRTCKHGAQVWKKKNCTTISL